MPLPVVNPANEEFDEGIDEIIEDLEPARSKSEGDAEVVSGSPGILKDPNGLRISAARVVRKAKRPSKSSSFCEDGNTPINGINGLNRSAKNLRRSRQGRGLPKKGGAGGKGTWGKLGDEIDLPWVDPNDPNYDSDTVEGKDKKLVKLNTLAPEMSEADVKKTVVPLV
ncbi:programmed cell death protein 4, partial [Eurytemora carolleeae]|uniref:programmed cell death protein 4 n=1 Tax=Eurytemora carolleeae TaxID=1294199 RepID=UPI000C7785EA